jgi:hypothetical protein
MQKEKIEKELQNINKQLHELGQNISFLVNILIREVKVEEPETEGNFNLDISDVIKPEDNFRSYLG